MGLKTTLLASAGAAAVLAVVSPVQAGGYVSIFGGWNSTDDIVSRAGSNGDVTFTTTLTHTAGPADTVTLTFGAPSTFFNSGAKAEDGFVVGAAVGGDLGHWLSGLRGEVEVSYRYNNLGAAAASASVNAIDTASGVFLAGNYGHSCALTPQAPAVVVDPPPAPCVAGMGAGGVRSFTALVSSSNAFASTEGSIRTFALMANAWFDVPMGGGFTPYFGGGVGYATNEVEHGLVMNGNNGGFAWQAGAGVNFAMTEKMSLGVGYRYMDAGDVTLIRSPALANGNKLVSDVHEVTHQSVLVNLTFALGK